MSLNQINLHENKFVSFLEQECTCKNYTVDYIYKNFFQEKQMKTI